jgi:hypothetical protein
MFYFKEHVSLFLALIRPLLPLDTHIFSYTNLLDKIGMGLAGTGYGKFLGFALCAISPAFVTFLLFKVSGIPLSEKKYDKRYGDRKDYQKWKNETPVFFPKF